MKKKEDKKKEQNVPELQESNVGDVELESNGLQQEEQQNR